MVNANLASYVMEEIADLGVQELCVCPGKRNAPWIGFLSAYPQAFKTYYFFDERSAAFFALGRIRATGRPVGVITTSGTAVGEMLPATMEAYYTGAPLVLLTADRPRHYRCSGAPQTAEQVNIFGIYAPSSFDLAEKDRTKISKASLLAPIHINVCFDEPLLDTADAYSWNSNHQILESSIKQSEAWGEASQGTEDLRQFFKQVKYPWIIVGGLQAEDRESVARLLAQWKFPVYLETISGLREDPRLNSHQIICADQLLERAHLAEYKIDGVIRIGGVPTPRFWRDLDEKLQHLPVFSLSSVPFSGLGRSSQLWHGPLAEICDSISTQMREVPTIHEGHLRRWIELESGYNERLQALLVEEPRSETGMLFQLSSIIPAQSKVYLGNSLPIREWDLAATRQKKNFQMWASRGVNGIDGQVSTFLGYSSPEQENWGVFGDLTALYDLQAPWVMAQLGNTRANIVVMNNFGGKIFDRMFPIKEFQNPHQLGFEHWARQWNLEYQAVENVLDLVPKSTKSRIIELLPSAEATQRFWKKYRP